MQRRDFITLLGSAAASGRFRRAGATAGDAGDRIHQERVGPVTADLVAALRQGLNEAGYVEGQNIAIEYRWGEGRTTDYRR